jgi:hypothetical protein
VRLTHSELQDCLNDPSRWVASKVNPAKGGPRPGYDFCLREGIYHYHKTGDLLAARTYIERTTSRRKLANRFRIDEILGRFDSYVQWYQNANIVVADHRSRLDYGLGAGVILGGTISRLDITDHGYRAILLGQRNPVWSNELRMPLIQRAMAIKYERPEDELSVGYQNLDGTQIELVLYSDDVLNLAENTAQQLATTISAEAATMGFNI